MENENEEEKKLKEQKRQPKGRFGQVTIALFQLHETFSGFVRARNEVPPNPADVGFRPVPKLADAVVARRRWRERAMFVLKWVPVIVPCTVLAVVLVYGLIMFVARLLGLA